LIHRHPHIYGEIEVENAEEVEKNWESPKLKEGKKSVLEGVPKSLPALVKAYRIQDKVAGVGFDWDKAAAVLGKVKEELEELQKEVDAADSDKMEAELGDVMFSLVNYARFLKINPENALERTNKKFIKRFRHVEFKAQALGKKINELTLAEMENFWQEAKLKD
jgi:XTP/dITP diphosphohydrolase